MQGAKPERSLFTMSVSRAASKCSCTLRPSKKMRWRRKFGALPFLMSTFGRKIAKTRHRARSRSHSSSSAPNSISMLNESSALRLRAPPGRRGQVPSARVAPLRFLLSPPTSYSSSSPSSFPSLSALIGINEPRARMPDTSPRAPRLRLYSVVSRAAPRLSLSLPRLASCLGSHCLRFPGLETGFWSREHCALPTRVLLLGSRITRRRSSLPFAVSPVFSLRRASPPHSRSSRTDETRCEEACRAQTMQNGVRDTRSQLQNSKARLSDLLSFASRRAVRHSTRSVLIRFRLSQHFPHHSQSVAALVHNSTFPFHESASLCRLLTPSLNSHAIRVFCFSSFSQDARVFQCRPPRDIRRVYFHISRPSPFSGSRLWLAQIPKVITSNGESK